MTNRDKLALALAPIILSPTMAFAGPADWQVSEISGAVSTGPANAIRPVSRGSLLHGGDMVSTGRGARVVLTRGEEFVIVSAASRLRLPDAEAAPGGITQWVEDIGTAVFHIKKMMTPHFGVRTPYLAAVVKGTTFSVTVGAQGASVQVVEGAVEVATSDGGAAELIRPGTVASVSAADRYRLNVDGATRRSIDSPGRGNPHGGPATPAPAASEPVPAVTVAVQDDAPALELLTGGLVHASPAAVAMASATSQQTSIGRTGIAQSTAGSPITTPPTVIASVTPVTQPTPVVPIATPAQPATPAPAPVVTVAMPGPAPVLPTPAPVVAVIATTPAPVVATPVPVTPSPVVAVVATSPSPGPAPTTSLLAAILAALDDARGHGNGKGNNGNGKGNGGGSGKSGGGS